jgi:hypothetical protein
VEGRGHHGVCKGGKVGKKRRARHERILYLCPVNEEFSCFYHRVNRHLLYCTMYSTVETDRRALEEILPQPSPNFEIRRKGHSVEGINSQVQYSRIILYCTYVQILYGTVHTVDSIHPVNDG